MGQSCRQYSHLWRARLAPYGPSTLQHMQLLSLPALQLIILHTDLREQRKMKAPSCLLYEKLSAGHAQRHPVMQHKMQAKTDAKQPCSMLGASYCFCLEHMGHQVPHSS